MCESKHHCFTCFFSIIVAVSLLSPASLVLGNKTSGGCEFPAIFNFGDSNSDTGGLSAVFGQAPPPHGVSFFHSPAGRYCDGRLVIDFIAERLGLPYLSAYLDSVGSNFTYGANFATAGSTIRRQNTTFFQTGYSPVSLDVQFNEFYDFHRRSQIARQNDGYFAKILPKKEDFSRALYMFDIGQNDLTSGYFLNMTTPEVKAYIPELLTQFKNTIESVYGQGGMFFWVHNTGPLGCLPYVLQRLPVPATQMDKSGCAIPFNEVSQYFNRGLKEVVVQLRKNLPLASITYVDVYSAKYSLIHQPKKHGFENPLSACCGHGEKYNYDVRTGCGSKAVVNGKEVLVGKACRNPKAWINWDGYHYTEAANKLVFEQIVTGRFSDPPVPLRMACH